MYQVAAFAPGPDRANEYLRQQGRRTVADAALDDRLRAFLQSGTEPDMAHFLTPPKPHHHDPDQK